MFSTLLRHTLLSVTLKPGIRGGQKIQKLDLNLALCVFPSYYIQIDTKKNLSFLGAWEVLPMEGPFSGYMEAKIQRIWPYIVIEFCFDHNFLLKKPFLNPFSLLIHILAVLRNDTNNGHIYGHIMAIQGWPFWPFSSFWP